MEVLQNNVVYMVKHVANPHQYSPIIHSQGNFTFISSRAFRELSVGSVNITGFTIKDNCKLLPPDVKFLCKDSETKNFCARIPSSLVYFCPT